MIHELVGDLDAVAAGNLEGGSGKHFAPQGRGRYRFQDSTYTSNEGST